MDSEIKNIYNRKVFEFRAKVREHEKAIFENKIKVENLDDFTHFCEKVQSMIQEYYSLFSKIHNNIDRLNLEKTLIDEFDYLHLLGGLIEALNHYHDVIGFVDSFTIQKEWQDVTTIVRYHYRKKDLEKQLEIMARKYFNIRRHPNSEAKEAKLTKDNVKFNRLLNHYRNLDKKNLANVQAASAHIEERGNATERLDEDYYKDYQLYQKIECDMEVFGRQALESLEHFLTIDEPDVKIYHPKAREKETEKNSIREKSPLEKGLLGAEQYSYYINLSLENKIKYIKLKLLDIEGIKGKKRYLKSVDKSISVKYFAVYKKYLAVLKELEKKERVEFAEESQIEAVSNDIYFVGDLAKNIDTELIQGVYQEEKNVINKQLLDEFYQERQNILDEMVENELYQEQERKLYSKIQFLKSLGQSSSKTQNEINGLRMRLKKTEEDRVHSLKSQAQSFFEYFHLPEEVQSFYINVIASYEKFRLSKNYKDAEKKSIFQDLYSKMKSFIEQHKDVSLNSFLQEQIEKMKEGLASIPVVKTMVSKIKKVRQPKNREKLHRDISRLAVSTAVILGTVVVSASSSVSHAQIEEAGVVHTSTIEAMASKDYYADHHEISVNSLETNTLESTDAKEENEIPFRVGEVSTTNVMNEAGKEEATAVNLEQKVDSKEIEETYNFAEEEFSFGDDFTVKEGAPVYMTYEDALKQENPLEMYFEADSMRAVAGVNYIYNGENVFVSEADPDYEAKIVALEQMGAIRNNDVVLATNENGIGPGFEGFYNREDIQFEEKGVRR